MCDHSHLCPEHTHYLTCTKCGTVVKTVYNPSDMQLYEDYTKAPLFSPYTRSSRFKKMLDSICLGIEFSNDRPMFEFLDQNPRDTPTDIIVGMQSSPFVDKRFCSLHVFMKYFCPQYLTPDPDMISRFHFIKPFLFNTFNDIEFKLIKRNTRFLNYRFVIDVILLIYKFDSWRCFVKPLKCPRRVLNCVRIFNSLHITVHDRVVVIPDTYSMSPKSLFRLQADHA